MGCVDANEIVGAFVDSEDDRYLELMVNPEKNVLLELHNNWFVYSSKKLQLVLTSYFDVWIQNNKTERVMIYEK